MKGAGGEAGVMGQQMVTSFLMGCIRGLTCTL